VNAELNQLALRLDAVVRVVPGVSSLFSAEPALVRSARAIAAAAPVALVSVAPGAEGLSIVASVGVSAAVQAPTTARTVSDAIRDALDPTVAETAAIHVRISRIAD
jgi:hypothetical protein